MKAALIPPIAHLEEFCDSAKLHLVLSHLLSNRAYYDFYREQRLRGAFLILDNGAHENKAGQSMEDLLLAALRLRASEIVLPDTLFDRAATTKGTEESLRYLLGAGQDLWGNRAYPGFMVVPQGSSRLEWENCFADLLQIYTNAQVHRRDLFPRTLTVGVSKDYDDLFPGGSIGLLEYLERFREWVVFEVHLLGWARNLATLWDLAHRFPWIRSTDSAKPFVYAKAGIELGLADFPEYPGRTPDYFESRLTLGQQRLARRNVEVFRKAAHDTSG